jgi:hypothetical protein
MYKIVAAFMKPYKLYIIATLIACNSELLPEGPRLIENSGKFTIDIQRIVNISSAKVSEVVVVLEFYHQCSSGGN